LPIKPLLEFFFPSNVTCNVCKSEYVYKYGLCSDCFDSLKKISGNRCDICLEQIDTEGLCAECLKKKPDYTRLYCSYLFTSPMSALIIGLKDSNKQYLSSHFAEIAFDTVENLDRITLITFVPSSKKRLRKRGYNQSELIARELSRLTNIPYDSVLLRKGDTKTSKLNKKEREKQIKDQFTFIKGVFDETVLLIDDVCTTGSTLRECASELKKAGAKEVFCFTVARTDYRS